MCALGGGCKRAARASSMVPQHFLSERRNERAFWKAEAWRQWTHILDLVRARSVTRCSPELFATSTSPPASASSRPACTLTRPAPVPPPSHTLCIWQQQQQHRRRRHGVSLPHPHSHGAFLSFLYAITPGFAQHDNVGPPQHSNTLLPLRCTQLIHFQLGLNNRAQVGPAADPVASVFRLRQGRHLPTHAI